MGRGWGGWRLGEKKGGELEDGEERGGGNGQLDSWPKRGDIIICSFVPISSFESDIILTISLLELGFWFLSKGGATSKIHRLESCMTCQTQERDDTATNTPEADSK